MRTIALLLLVTAAPSFAQNVSLGNLERDSHFVQVDDQARSARLGATFVGGLIGAAVGSSVFIYSLTQQPPQGAWVGAGIGTLALTSSVSAWVTHLLWGGRGTYWSSLLGALGGVVAGGLITAIGFAIELSYIEAQRILGNTVPLDVVLPCAVGLGLAVIVAPLLEVAALDSTDVPSALKNASIGIMPINGGAMATLGMRF